MTLIPHNRLITLAVAVAAALASAAPEVHAEQTRPNIVVVMTDDERVWDMDVMPRTKRLIGEAGTTFENSFATDPLCCPSRATFLSGQYEHNHGVLDNEAPEGGYGKFDFANALGVWLQAAGYRTAHIGKQLNEYGVLTMPAQQQVAPGYDDWFATRDPTTYSMYNYVVQENAVRHPYGELPEDYQTDVLAGRALEDIRQWAPDDRPFFIHLATSAPHHELYDAEDGPRPAPRHDGAFADLPFRPRANYDEEDISDKPSVIRHYERIGPELADKIVEMNRHRLESLQAVDEAVGRIVDELERAGELDRTLIVFTSDNGYFYGEHRVPNQKVVHYEESSRVPLLIRGPGFTGGVTRDQLVGNIDLAPTIVEVAGANPTRVMDGESLLPFARSPDHRRARSLVIESDFPPVSGTTALIIPPYHQGVNVFYDAIRTPRYKYVHWFRDVSGNAADEEELYDLQADPFELRSLHASASHAKLKEQLKRELTQLQDCKGSGCHGSFHDPCFAAPVRVRRRSIGRLRLGATRAGLARAAGDPRRARGGVWRYCTSGRGRLYAVFSGSDRVRLLVATTVTSGARGARRGTPVAVLRRTYRHARFVTPGVLAAGGRSRLVFGIRRGRVRCVGLADRALRADPRLLRRYLHAAGL
jgi:N-acetylglucosamine-6-sulfatase